MTLEAVERADHRNRGLRVGCCSHLSWHQPFGTTVVRIFPPRSNMPMTAVLSFVPVPVIRRLRSLTCMFRALPPMNDSSTSTSPSEQRLVPPNGYYPAFIPLTLTGNEVDGWILDTLMVSIVIKVFYVDAMDKAGRQTFTNLALRNQRSEEPRIFGKRPGRDEKTAR